MVMAILVCGGYEVSGGVVVVSMTNGGGGRVNKEE